MKKISLKLVVLMMSLSFLHTANASVFEDEVNTDEIANILYQCSSELNALKTKVTKRGAKQSIVYIKSVKAKSFQITGDLTVKAYLLKLVSSNGGINYSETLEGELAIAHKVTRTSGGKPSLSEYVCTVD